jgi:hypothetical protein
MGLSVVLKPSHPLGPILRLDAAGFGPTAGRVKISVPFQCPEFFEPDPSYRPIQEKAVYMPVVPVYAKGFHTTAHTTNSSISVNPFPLRMTGLLLS